MKTIKTMLAVLALTLAACNGGAPADGTPRAKQDLTLKASRSSGEGKTSDTKVVCPLPGQIAVAEICNGFDDDCDGVIDEGVCSDPCDETW